MILLLCLGLLGCKERSREEVVVSLSRKPATPPPSPPPAAPAPPARPPDPLGGRFTLQEALAGLPPGRGPLQAVLELEKEGQPLGTLHCDLFADKAPLAVANFVGLARGLRPFFDPRTGRWEKRPFYDGIFIHRITPGYIIQAGDPHCYRDPGCAGVGGAGDPGYAFADEIDENQRFLEGGLLAMANRGPNTNGSQFFITERPTPWLTGHHTVFGRCAETDLVHKLTELPRGQRDLPQEPLLIKKVTIRYRTG
ncbi:MAG: peptidylprolyl isomerase [Myxococcota bacterium]|nr:peptidylprolyl isomerase [Myxococcota bacterium]